MVTIVRALKELKASVKFLEEKANKSESDDIQEIVKSQKNAIKRTDEEIKKISNQQRKD